MCLFENSFLFIHLRHFDWLILSAVKPGFAAHLLFLVPSRLPFPLPPFSPNISPSLFYHTPFLTILLSFFYWRIKSSLSCSSQSLYPSLFFLPVPASTSDPGGGEDADQCRACGDGRSSGDQRWGSCPSWPSHNLLQRMQGRGGQLGASGSQEVCGVAVFGLSLSYFLLNSAMTYFAKLDCCNSLKSFTLLLFRSIFFLVNRGKNDQYLYDPLPHIQSA